MILVCYDIEHNSLRTRLAHKLLDAGLDRINLSVYLGDPKAGDLKRLTTWLQQAMTKAGPRDSLLILPVTQHQVWQMEVLGRNDFDVPTLTGDRHTLIL